MRIPPPTAKVRLDVGRGFGDETGRPERDNERQVRTCPSKTLRDHVGHPRAGLCTSQRPKMTLHNGPQHCAVGPNSIKPVGSRHAQHPITARSCRTTQDSCARPACPLHRHITKQKNRELVHRTKSVRQFALGKCAMQRGPPPPKLTKPTNPPTIGQGIHPQTCRAGSHTPQLQEVGRKQFRKKRCWSSGMYPRRLSLRQSIGSWGSPHRVCLSIARLGWAGRFGAQPACSKVSTPRQVQSIPRLVCAETCSTCDEVVGHLQCWADWRVALRKTAPRI